MVKNQKKWVVRKWQQEGYVGGLGAKPPAAGGKRVWGQAVAISYVLCIIQTQNALTCENHFPGRTQDLARGGGCNRGSGCIALSRQRILKVFT